MPGLMKIGYSTKHPSARAEELDGSGLPYKFVMEYCALVENPYGLEQAVHTWLGDKREAKEFFRIDIEQAILGIYTSIQECGGQLFYEEGDLRSRRLAEKEARERAEREALERQALEIARRQKKEWLHSAASGLIQQEQDALSAILDIMECYLDAVQPYNPGNAPSKALTVDESWCIRAIENAAQKPLITLAEYDITIKVLRDNGMLPLRADALRDSEREAERRRTSAIQLSRPVSDGYESRPSPWTLEQQERFWIWSCRRDQLQKRLCKYVAVPDWQPFFYLEPIKPLLSEEKDGWFVRTARRLFASDPAPRPTPRTHWLDFAATRIGRAIRDEIAKRQIRVKLPF